MRNLHFLSIIVLKKKAGEIEQLGGEQRAQQRVVSRNSNEAIGQCASRLLDDPRRLVSPYTPLQCPSLPYPITLFNADSASAECSATTIGPPPDESRFSFFGQCGHTTVTLIRKQPSAISTCHLAAPVGTAPKGFSPIPLKARLFRRSSIAIIEGY